MIKDMDTESVTEVRTERTQKVRTVKNRDWGTTTAKRVETESSEEKQKEGEGGKNC